MRASDRRRAFARRAALALLAPLFAVAAPFARAADVLNVGFSSNKPPYVIEASASGIEVDIIIAAGRAAGFAVKPNFAPMSRLARMLERGEVDAIATTNYGDSGEMQFSREYIEYQNFAVALAARKLRIERIADLEKYSVSSFQRAQTLLGPEFNLMASNNPRYREEAEQIVRNRLLLSGRVDVVVGDRRIIEYFNREIAGQVDTAQPLAWYALFPPTPYRVGFRDGAKRDRFNAGLAAIRKNGEYAAIMKRYAAY